VAGRQDSSAQHPVAQLRVALTGGVGSGKSTVGDLLAGLGAVRIDADQVARAVVAPGTPGLAAVVARFGANVLGANGELDRAALADIVFDDEAARADLNAIIHPLVAQRSGELMAAAAPDAVIVYEVPLLAETGRSGEFDAVIVVEAALGLRLARLAGRGLPEAQARSRIAAQASDEQRRAIADYVVGNDSNRADLARSVRAVWDRLLLRRASALRTPPE
jgi:dephospho-CoA kinase